MTNFIHYSAKIHKTAIIGPNVHISPGVYIGPYCIIGMPPEHIEYFHKDEDGGVFIGPDTVLTGANTVDAGTKWRTVIGSNCFLMKGVHVGHDVKIGNRVTVSPGARFGGCSTIMDGTTVGMNAVIHQYKVIPPYTMIGMGAVVPMKVVMEKAGQVFAGNPARLLGINQVAIERHGLVDMYLENKTQEYLRERWEKSKTFNKPEINVY
jgi:UDP-N-acetylglucosamine acyltransferase